MAELGVYLFPGWTSMRHSTRRLPHTPTEGGCVCVCVCVCVCGGGGAGGGGGGANEGVVSVHRVCLCVNVCLQGRTSACCYPGYYPTTTGTMAPAYTYGAQPMGYAVPRATYAMPTYTAAAPTCAAPMYATGTAGMGMGMGMGMARPGYAM